MDDPTTTSGGSTPNMGADAAPTLSSELAGGSEGSVLVGTNRTGLRKVDPRFAGPLAHLRAAREALDRAEYWIGMLAHELHPLPAQKARIDQARVQTQGAHGLLWAVSRELADGGPGEPL